jgi:hypothetical protein
VTVGLPPSNTKDTPDAQIPQLILTWIGLEHGADAPGALLLGSSVMLAVYTIVQASHHAWGSARTLALAAIAVLLTVGFLACQARAATPLMPLRIFHSRRGSSRRT